MIFALFVVMTVTQTSQPALPQAVVEQIKSADSLCTPQEFPQAEMAYRRILSQFPNSLEALAAYGRCDLAMGRGADAARLLSEVVRRQPGNRDAKRDFARALVEINQFGPAEQALKELTGSQKTDKDSWYYLGVLMYQNGYYGAADEAFAESVSASADASRHTKTQIYRAVCWVKIGRVKQAESVMADLAKQAEAQKDPDLLLVYAELLYETQRPNEALQKVNEAISARPDLVMGYFWKGKVLYRMGRLADAASEEERAIQMMPILPYPRSLLVKIYLAEGRKEDAAKQADWLRAYEDRMSQTSR